MAGRSSYVACGCGSEMKVVKNGVVWCERLEDGTPYKLFAGDLCQCKRCTNSAIHLNTTPLAVKHEPNFQKIFDASSENGLIVG